jgi:hypothetical protein
MQKKRCKKFKTKMLGPLVTNKYRYKSRKTKKHDQQKRLLQGKKGYFQSAITNDEYKLLKSRVGCKITKNFKTKEILKGG